MKRPTEAQQGQQGQKREGADKKTLLKEVYDNVSRETYFTLETLPEMLEELNLSRYLIKSRGIELYNAAACFDIETYSFYEGKEKRALMYIWQLSINGLCVIGRTWAEFEQCFDYIRSALDLNEKKRLFVFVHNLSYEFQWICKRFEWLKVFAIDERKPVYAITTSGFEFRCSYILSGYALATLAENLQYKIEKLDTLDYLKARNSKTRLSKDEILYCLNDVKIICVYIAELLQTEYNLNTIPLTKTGFVRRFCRDSCFVDAYDKKNPFKRIEYRKIIENLTLTVQEFKQLQRAFQGGFTHASAWYSGQMKRHVVSKDITSSYPYVMVAYKYPMGAPEHVEISNTFEFKKNLCCYCCCFDIYFEDLEATTQFENYISVSRCFHKVGVQENNGRVVEAKELWLTITDQDFLIINKMYTWSKMKVSNFMRFHRGYLPRDFVKAVLTLYRDKTVLKGVVGKEQEYQYKKEMLNSCY